MALKNIDEEIVDESLAQLRGIFPACDELRQAEIAGYVLELGVDMMRKVLAGEGADE